MNQIISSINTRDFKFSLHVSKTYTSLLDIKQYALNSKKRSSKITLIKKSLHSATQSLLSYESIFKKIIRLVLKFFGYITKTQQYLFQLKSLKDSNNLLAKTNNIHLIKHEKFVSYHLTKIFNVIERFISKLQSANRKICSFKQAIKKSINQKKLLKHQKRIIKFTTQLYKLNIFLNRFNELNTPHYPAFAKVQEIINLFNSTKAKIFKINLLVANKFLILKNQSEEKIAGISNGGNTCYIASALQVINNIQEYRDLFNAKLNKLTKRANETEISYLERTLIQQIGYHILNKITDGSTVKSSEINKFRKYCFLQKVVTTKIGPNDANETLAKILAILDFKDPIIEITYKNRAPKDLSKWKILKTYDDLTAIQNLNFSTIKDMQTPKKEQSSFTFYTIPYVKSKNVKMKQLFRNYQKTEIIPNRKFLGKFKNTTVLFEVDYLKRFKEINSYTLPKTLQITVIQEDQQSKKVKISEPQQLIIEAQIYRLKAAIEHRPSHYVAHISTDNGMFEVNDSSVYKSNYVFPGTSYFYEKI